MFYILHSVAIALLATVFFMVGYEFAMQQVSNRIFKTKKDK